MPVRILIAALALSGPLALAATKPQPSAEVQMIVTSADHMNHQPLALKGVDLKIVDATITDLVPFKGGRDLDLYILIDDAANYDFGAKLRELRQFVTSQPAATSIGVAFIREGTLDVVEQPTRDHQRAAQALRAPSGSIAANPYCALSGLIDSLRNNSVRHEIVLVSTGMDDSATGGVCMNAERTIHDAERAGAVIYAIYNPVAGYASEKWSKVESGIVDLAHVSYETGGEAYFMGHNPPNSIEPFLADITEHLANQYLVKFRLTGGPESGFQRIQITSGTRDQELMKPETVWVPIPAALNSN
jgi:hypothetical protein